MRAGGRWKCSSASSPAAREPHRADLRSRPLMATQAPPRRGWWLSRLRSQPAPQEHAALRGRLDRRRFLDVAVDLVDGGKILLAPRHRAFPPPAGVRAGGRKRVPNIVLLPYVRDRRSRIYGPGDPAEGGRGLGEVGQAVDVSPGNRDRTAASSPSGRRRGALQQAECRRTAAEKAEREALERAGRSTAALLSNTVLTITTAPARMAACCLGHLQLPPRPSPRRAACGSTASGSA